MSVAPPCRGLSAKHARQRSRITRANSSGIESNARAFWIQIVPGDWARLVAITVAVAVAVSANLDGVELTIESAEREMAARSGKAL